MKSRAAAALLCASLVPMLGVGHCPAGDARAFEEPCLRIVGAGSRPSTKVVSLATWSASFGHPPVRSLLEVTTCNASYSRIVGGVVEEFGPGRLEPGDARSLHDALVDAGGLTADSAPVAIGNCAVSHSEYRSEVIVYEPSPLRGTAWSNAFDFGTCQSSPQTTEVDALLSAWIAAHFDLSQPLPETIALPGGSTVMPPQIHLITPFD